MADRRQGTWHENCCMLPCSTQNELFSVHQQHNVIVKCLLQHCVDAHRTTAVMRSRNNDRNIGLPRGAWLTGEGEGVYGAQSVS